MEIKNKFGKLILEYNADTLEGADLNGAYLIDADLRGADLNGADLNGADIRGADLRGAYLRCADIRGADLRGAYLRGADLRGAYLRCADLSGADLRGADLRCADLSGADLRGAYLSGADLSGADLSGAIVHEGSTIENNINILIIGLIGSRKDYTHFYNCRGGEIIVQCGCFRGTIDEFEKKVKKKHRDTQYGKNYRDTIEYVRRVFEENKNKNNENRNN